jgi:hypothetical protein
MAAKTARSDGGGVHIPLAGEEKPRYLVTVEFTIGHRPSMIRHRGETIDHF